MTTLNNVLNLFKDIADRHKQINGYKSVQNFDIDTSEGGKLPLLAVNPVGLLLPRGENGYKMLAFSIDMQVIDLLNKDLSNENDVLSDTAQIITDIITEFSSHPTYFNLGIDITNDISLDPLRGVYDTDLTGYKCTMDLEVPVNTSYCSNPVEHSV